MLLIAGIIWVVFGLLGNSQQKDNLAISVDCQKRFSLIMVKPYRNNSWGEIALFTFINLLFLIGSIIGGVLFFLLTLKIHKQVTARRMVVEKAHQKMYGSGWCS